MTFDDILAQVLELLQREGRVSYRALKVRFDLDDDYIDDLKDELIYAKQLAIDEENRVLVWIGEQASASRHPRSLQPQNPLLLQPQTKNANPCPTRPNTLPRKF